MNFDISSAIKAKESGSVLTPGIKDATFMGIEFEAGTSQSTGDPYKALVLKLDIDGHGEFTQKFFEPKDDERKEMQWGPSASPLDHFLITIREILEAVDPQILKDIDNGDKSLSGNFKQIVDSMKKFTADKAGKVKVQIKLLPQRDARFVSMPSFPARITRNGDLGIATRIIGHDLTLTASELKRIEAASTAEPTNMANNDLVNAMSSDLDSKDSDLPF